MSAVRVPPKGEQQGEQHNHGLDRLVHQLLGCFQEKSRSVSGGGGRVKIFTTKNLSGMPNKLNPNLRQITFLE